MPRIEVESIIHAPIERCFDLSLSIDYHIVIGKKTHEEAVDGVLSGLIGLNQEVTWQAIHLGFRQKLTTRIMELERPKFFRALMIRGAFKKMDSVHFFESLSDGRTRLLNRMDIEAPLGLLGRIAETLFLTAYMRRMLEDRQALLKEALEGNDWKQYLKEEASCSG